MGYFVNIGSYILLFTIIFFNISGILFYKCGFNLLEDNIKEIVESKEGNKNENNNNIKETKIKDNYDSKIIQFKKSKKKKENKKN